MNDPETRVISKTKLVRPFAAEGYIQYFVLKVLFQHILNVLGLVPDNLRELLLYFIDIDHNLQV